MPLPHQRQEDLFLVDEKNDPDTVFYRQTIRSAVCEIEVGGGMTILHKAAEAFSEPVTIPQLLHGTDIIHDSVDVVISSAEILALFATPIEIVAAPGANKAITRNDFSNQLMQY